jgi:hypothetical protein
MRSSKAVYGADHHAHAGGRAQPLSVGAFPDKCLSAQHLAEHMLAFEGVPGDSQQQERTTMKRSELIDAMASGCDSLNERDVRPH